MKKVFLLFVAFISAMQSFAQEADALQSQSATVSLDSLSVRLNKLQHNYDFMYCDFELYKTAMDLKDLAQNIELSSKGVIINYYNNRFDRALYTSYLRNYDSCCALFDTLKKRRDVLRIAVIVKMASSSFSDEELDVINSSLNVIESAVTTVEKSLDYYDVAIKAFRDKR